MDFLKQFTYIMIIIGGINWGLTASFNFDAITFLFGKGSYLSLVTYDLIAISAVISAAITVSCNIGNNRAC